MTELLDPESLEALLAKAKAAWNAMTPEQQQTELTLQRESWVRAEMAQPPAKYEMVNGVKVYASYEDYCNG
jgi:hypothetical protein